MQYKVCIFTLDDLSTEQGLLLLSQSTTVKDDYSTAAGEELNNRAGVDVGVRFELKPLKVICGVLRVEECSYGILKLSTALSWVYNRLYVKEFCRYDLLKRVRRESKRYGETVSVQKGFFCLQNISTCHSDFLLSVDLLI